jgi:multidrug resistance efflux pump
MIVVLLNAYIALLALFVWLRFIPFNTFWKLSPVIVLLVLLVGLFIPMGWGAPSGPAAVIRNSVQIVPSVAGEVVDVPVAANTPVKEGDVLFRIDPTTYQAQVQAIEAQLKFAELRLGQFSELQRRDTGRAFDVQERESEVAQLRAQLDGARWNLDRTTVRAPADGYVTNLALRKGARVTGQSPVMAFIDTSETIFGVEIQQISARYVEVGQPVEITFKAFAGRSSPERSRRCCRPSRPGTRSPAVWPSCRRRSRRRRSSSGSRSTTRKWRAACQPGARVSRRSSPSMSRRAMSSARSCCGRGRS